MGPTKIDQQTTDFIVGTIRNQLGAAEGTLLPPKQVGPTRVPVASNLKIVKKDINGGATEFTIVFQEAQVPQRGVDHYLVTASLATSNTQSTINSTVSPGSPVLIGLSSFRFPTGTVMIFTIQTVLKNGLTSLRQFSPTVSGTML